MQQIKNIIPILKKWGEKYQALWYGLFLILLVSLCLWSVLNFIWATEPRGIGVRSDSVAYFWSAESLVKGAGLGRLTGDGNFKPMTHWPPLYPIMLAIFNGLGFPILSVARWMGVALFALNIFLAGLCFARVTRSLWFSISAALILAFSPGFWTTSLDAMTEPLYLSLSLTAVLCFDLYLENGKRKWLIPLILSLAGCFLTRYIGFAILISMVIVLLLHRIWPLFERIKKGAIILVFSSLPLAGWMVRNMLMTGSPTNRQTHFFPISTEDFTLSVQTLSSWFDPNQAIFQIGLGKVLVILVVAVFFAFYGLAQKGRPNLPIKTRIPLVSLIYILIYTIGIMASRLFFDPLITFFEQRIAFLIYIPLLCLIIYALSTLYRYVRQKSFLISMVLVLFYTLTLYSYFFVYQTEDETIFNTIRTNGLGYNDITLKDPCVIEKVKGFSSDTIIYSDNVERLYFFTGRSSNQIVDKNAIPQIASQNKKPDKAFVFFYTPEFNTLAKTAFPGGVQLCEKTFVYQVNTDH